MTFSDTIHEKQQHKDTTINFDPDSSPLAWEHYKKYYTPTHWNLMQILCDNNLYLRNNRLIISTNDYLVNNNKSSFIISEDFEFGGETDFNFKNKNFKKKIYKEDIELLNYCFEMHHNLLNFSIMSRTGGQNLYKGKGYDRLDTHICDIDAFLRFRYDQNIELLERFESRPNSVKLKKFLNKFIDIYDYCEKIYFIFDKKFVDALIDSGNAHLKTNDDFRRYMCFAKYFWQCKKEYFLNNNKLMQIGVFIKKTDI